MTISGTDAETVPQIVAALRQDPVLVQQVLGNGHTAEVDGQLTALAGDVAHPVWLVLVQAPAGLAHEDPTDDLLRQVHQQLQEPGIYVVASTVGIESVETYDVPLDGTDLSLARFHTLDRAHEILGQDHRLSAAGEAALTLEVAADPDLELTDRQIHQVTDDPIWVAVTESEPDTYEEYDKVDDPLTPVVVAVATALVVAAVAWRLLRARAAALLEPHDRRAPSGTEAATSSTPSPETLRGQARTALKRLDRRLRKGSVDPAALDEAQGSRDAAADLVESDDLLDVVGALVLVTIGYAATRRGGAPYRPCFFNPLHGEGDHRAASGQGGPTVPACRRCAADVESGTAPDALVVARRGRDRPYYEQSTVWARTGFGSLTDDLWIDVRQVGRR
ncbi:MULTISPECIES: hypothetical protein [unclassified Nocardioides]|uniref:hypothetical protein n=1 Tax=unclassified Nocardioides TaxID=2615069 RepID=UPI0010548E67|nr:MULTISPECIES: hypothetical protein [unclassified Nocardioides]